MRTIGQPGEYQLEVKKSRFLCALARVTTEEQAREFVRHRRRLHHEARHHCSAYVLGDDGQTQKSSDDGEPAGTAGVPMLEVLRRNDITNTVAVVSRHFGGVLLGAGGLIRAYGGAVSEALEHVGLVERREMRVVSTTVDHGVAGKLENDLRRSDYLVADVHYGARVRFDLHIPETDVAGFETWLAEATGGAATIGLGGSVHTEVPVTGT
ncbi:putative YigZ family protein [Halopolyspora algeriensis]|uniref:Putative YigZ family protein n=1 Tax=Halopolyspora algeriensis TaxID=1500506 RepID=A0A368VZX7_9ACTN|nr:YigZ family protein [Halopolyspora algeriensis]RCW46989.1 putative YigZ family protein [Halopolyspora algeriensis]TQM48078.1 putative YigZ family protein [Halopolyspora algeriensis]